MVGLGRVELPTSPLSGVRSNQLSYRPVFERPHCNEPGSSYQPYSVLKKGFEDKVERAPRSYAARDHRKNRNGQRRPDQDSLSTVRDGFAGLMDTPFAALAGGPLSRKEWRAIASLLERR